MYELLWLEARRPPGVCSFDYLHVLIGLRKTEVSRCRAGGGGKQANTKRQAHPRRSALFCSVQLEAGLVIRVVVGSI